MARSANEIYHEYFLQQLTRGTEASVRAPRFIDSRAAVRCRERCKGVHCVDLGESFQTNFSCKMWLRYSRERALQDLPHPATAARRSRGSVGKIRHCVARSCPISIGTAHLDCAVACARSAALIRACQFSAPGPEDLRSESQKLVESPPNFERLVLGCIDADFCKYILNTHSKALDEIYKI